MQTKAKLPHLGQEYSSPWDNIYPYSEMGRWVTDTTTGALKYKLDPLDSSKKLDGSPSVLDGTDGDVMVKVPRFGYKVEFNEDGTSNYYITATRPNDSATNLPSGFKIHPAFIKGDGTFSEYFLYGAFLGSVSGGKLRSSANKEPASGFTITQFRSYARSERIKHGIIHVNMISALQILYLCEFQNTDSQSSLGLGNVAWGTDKTTGKSIKIGDRSGYINSGAGNGSESIVYRGVEDFFSGKHQFVDGILIENNGYYYSNNPEFYGDKNNSVFCESIVPTSIQFVSKITQNEKIEHCFLPDYSTNGSNSTFFCDKVNGKISSATRLLTFGSSAGWGATTLDYGIFCYDQSGELGIQGSDYSTRLSFSE